MQDKKPSSRELYNRLADARAAFDADPNRVFILGDDPSIHVEDDMEELDLDDLDDYWDLVYECIQQDDQGNNYIHIDCHEDRP